MEGGVHLHAEKHLSNDSNPHSENYLRQNLLPTLNSVYTSCLYYFEEIPSEQNNPRRNGQRNWQENEVALDIV